MRKFIVNNPLTELGEWGTFLEYEILDKIGIRVESFRDLHSTYRITLDDMEFFENCGEDRYVGFRLYKGGNLAAQSVLRVNNDPLAELLAEKEIELHIDDILALPLYDKLPQPLKRIVNEQHDTTYGMLFIEKDEDFFSDWTKKEYETLSDQVQALGLSSYIEMPQDWEDIPSIPEGEPVLTAYCGLATKFNFI